MRTTNKIFLMLLIMLLSSNLYPDTLNIDKINLAMDEMYRMNYQSSYSLFNEVAIADSNLFFASIGLLMSKRFLLLEETGYFFNNSYLVNVADSIYDNWHKRLQRIPENDELNLCIGLLLGFKSRLLLSEKKWLKLFVSGYNSMNYFENTVQINPENYDARLCLGIYNFGVSVSPGYIKFASKLFLKNPGTKDESLDIIKIASNKAKYLNYEAMSSLSFIYLYIEDLPQQSIIYSQYLDNMFPENPFYSFITCISQLQQNQIHEATKTLNELNSKVQSLNNFLKQEYEYRLSFLEGLLAMRMSNYVQSETIFLKFIQGNILELDHLIAMACLELGKMYDIKNDRKKAKKYYRKTIKYNTHLIFENQAKKYIKNPYVVKP